MGPRPRRRRAGARRVRDSVDADDRFYASRPDVWDVARSTAGGSASTRRAPRGSTCSSSWAASRGSDASTSRSCGSPSLVSVYAQQNVFVASRDGDVPKPASTRLGRSTALLTPSATRRGERADRGRSVRDRLPALRVLAQRRGAARPPPWSRRTSCSSRSMRCLQRAAPMPRRPWSSPRRRARRPVPFIVLGELST